MKGKHQQSVAHQRIVDLEARNAALVRHVEELQANARQVEDAEFLRLERQRLTERVLQLEREATEVPKLRAMLDAALTRERQHTQHLLNYRRVVLAAARHAMRRFPNTASPDELTREICDTLGLRFGSRSPIGEVMQRLIDRRYAGRQWELDHAALRKLYDDIETGRRFGKDDDDPR